MKIFIRWKNVDKSDSIINFLEEKLSDLSQFNFVNEKIKVEIVKYEKIDIYKIRINLSLHNSTNHRIEGESKDIYAALNDVCKKCVDFIRNEKDKIVSKKSN